MSSNGKIRNLAHFTSQVSLLPREDGRAIFRIFKVFHPVLEAETDIKVREVSSSYHILEKFMDLLVCGKKESRNPNVARIKDKDELLSLLGINYEGYEIASIYFDDLVAEGHFKVTDSGIYPLNCAQLSIDSVDLEALYNSLKEDTLPAETKEENENVKLEYKYTEKILYEKKLFDQFSLELMPKEFYGLDGFLAVSPDQKVKTDGEKEAVWLSPGIKLVNSAAAIGRTLDNIHDSDVSFIERGIPEGTHSITLAPDCVPDLIYCPYYLVVCKDNEGALSFAVHEVLYGKEVGWMSDKYNNAEDEKNEYLDAKNLITAICQKEENCSVYSPIFADWPLKIHGRIAYEYGYRQGNAGNYIWQMQPWQLQNILKKCGNAQQRMWVEFALESRVGVLNSYEAGRLVEICFPEDLREKIEQALTNEPERQLESKEETSLYNARDLFIRNNPKAEGALKELSEHEGEANYLLGSLYLKKEDFNLSIEYFKRAREMGYAPAGYFLCVALINQKGAEVLEEIKNILCEDEPNGFAPTLYALSVLLREEDPEKSENLRAKAEEMGYTNQDAADILCSVLLNVQEDAKRIKAQEEGKLAAMQRAQEIKEALTRIEEAAEKADSEKTAETGVNTAEVQKVPYNEPHFSEEVDKTVSFGENLTLSAEEIIKQAAENYPKAEFTDEEYKKIFSRIMGEYTPEELETLTGNPKKHHYNTTAFVREPYYPGLCSNSCNRKPLSFTNHSVALTYGDFAEYSKVTSVDFLKTLPYIDAEEFFALDPDPFSKIIPDYKNSPKISDRHDLSYRYAPLSAHFEDLEFEDFRKIFISTLEGKTRYETVKTFKRKHLFENPTQNAAIMLFWANRQMYTTRDEDNVLKSFKETLAQNGEISQLLKKADLSLSQNDTKAAEEILLRLTPVSGHAAFLAAQINRRYKDAEKYTENLLLARRFCSPYAFDITDNAFPYGDFKEFSSVYNLSKRIGKYCAEVSDISSYFDIVLDSVYNDHCTENDSLAASFLNGRKNFLRGLESALKKELENTPFLPALTHRNDQKGFAVAAALGGVVAAQGLAEKFLKAKNYTGAENCLTFAASRGNVSAAKALVNFYLSAENWNPQKACYVLDRICDVDPAAMALYVLLFKSGLDTEIKEYREIVQATRNVFSKF